MSKRRKGSGSPAGARTAPGEGLDKGPAIRTKQGRFAPGVSGNPEGRPGGYAEFRELCRSKSPAAVTALEDALGDGGPSAVAAARVLLEYGWGKPAAAPEDLEAVREGAGVALSQLTREDLLKVAKLPVEDE